MALAYLARPRKGARFLKRPKVTTAADVAAAAAAVDVDKNLFRMLLKPVVTPAAAEGHQLGVGDQRVRIPTSGDLLASLFGSRHLLTI